MTMRLIDFFDQGVRYHAKKTAFVDSESSYSYGEADTKIHKIAAAIRGNDFDKGTRIGVYSPNSNNAWLALLGLMRAEGIWLPINPKNSVETNVDLTSRFETKILFYDSCFNQEVEEIQSAVPTIAQFVCINGEGAIGTNLADFVDGQPEFHEIGEPETNELAAIFPTGGTTGKSKGVLMNHEALETFASNYHGHFQYKEDSVHLVVAPMTHSAGIMGCLHVRRQNIWH
ncbi:MAG: hypothetical protein COA68_15655 [Oceanobacter sp.]|nr:MAG: hypothetical protein COA68_15655 [Oceanobacter sp.]